MPIEVLFLIRSERKFNDLNLEDYIIEFNKPKFDNGGIICQAQIKFDSDKQNV